MSEKYAAFIRFMEEHQLAIVTGTLTPEEEAEFKRIVRESLR